jgi:hypothetical protein
MDKLADCKRAIRIALIHCIAFWIALADKSRFSVTMPAGKI